MRLRNIFPIISLFVMSVSITSCHQYKVSALRYQQYKNRQSEPTVTIVVKHSECTGCLDGVILEGTITVPADLTIYFSDTLKERDIVLAGKFPFDLVNMNSVSFDPFLMFRITGKLVGTESTAGSLNSPVFYVEKWEAIKDTIR